ncbi:MAG TPA: tyrosine-type recombinase/integrase [Gallionellaceae bacterium]|nr:tyrosine-type recombinase/integrase [Gallionellaceae bacterium]
MLSDTKLKNLKSQEKPFKVSDRDGLYVMVLPSGSISFRYNYKINGRYETLTIGKYGNISLAEARELLVEAKKSISTGSSPARAKAREKKKLVVADTFGEWAETWLTKYVMAESTRDMKRSGYERDLKPFAKLKMAEFTDTDLRALCEKIVERGAPATAIHVREIVQAVYRYAADKGHKYQNPADTIKPTSIAIFKPRERALSPEEVGILFEYLDKEPCFPSIKMAIKLLLLTMLRKSELIEATWDEINFTNALWTIPASRMKMSKAHNIYLSSQAMDILTALKMCAGGSKYVLPGRYDADLTMSKATLNRTMTLACDAAQKAGRALEHCGPHDLRRTASTMLHEAGYNSDWIEKCLAHEQKGVRAVYNKAEYAEQRRSMLQDWANMVDQFTKRP